MDEKYYLVNKEVLPAVFEKVINAKRLLCSGSCKTVRDAVKKAGISRSVFYKYKNNVSIFVEKAEMRIITLNMLLSDEVGVLSEILSYISSGDANILTINQNIPIDGVAPVSVSVTAQNMEQPARTLINGISGIKGVIRVDLVATE